MDVTRREITKIAREVGKFAARTLKAEGVGTAEFDVIHLVRHRPGVTQAEICKALGIDKGAVARQTANLEAKGYLTRRENPADGRSRLLYATEKAEQLKNSKARVETVFYEWLLEEMSETDKRTFSEALDGLYRRSKEESRAGFARVAKRLEETKDAGK